jgi:ribosomal protein L4
MASTKLLNILGQECGTIKLNDSVFKQEYNEALIHQVVVAYNNNQRQSNADFGVFNINRRDYRQ